MNVSMESMENNNAIGDGNKSEQQQSQSEGAESGVRPTLSQVTKSWGFRRTTIAKREFLEEVGDISHSPPPARKARSRKTRQTQPIAPETSTTQSTTYSARSVIDELQWSAPSSPASEDGKLPSETSAGGSLDPCLWEDFGSAFHTAFSLLGGEEGLSMSMSDALGVSEILDTQCENGGPSPQAMEKPEVPDNMDDVDMAEPVIPDEVAQEEMNDVILVSSQEDSDDMTLSQLREQLTSSGQENTKVRGGKGGRGRARGRGRGRARGRGRGKGRGRGRGRAAVPELSIAEEEEDIDEVILINAAKPQLSLEEKDSDALSTPGMQVSPAHFDTDLSPSQGSDCILIDSDSEKIHQIIPGQYDDAPEEEKEEGKTVEFTSISDTLHCICRQKRNKRFMICCDSCQEWFHGDCIGISEAAGRKMERDGQEYNCPSCSEKKHCEVQSASDPQPFPDLTIPECLTLSPPVEGMVEKEQEEEQQARKETVAEEEKVPVTEEESQHEPKAEPQSVVTMETDSSVPICIGPDCSKQALAGSVYCGTDCIIQHAAFTMKTLSVPKVPKPKGRSRKEETARSTVKGQRQGRMSKRLAAKVEEELWVDDEKQEAAAPSKACDPDLSGVQASSISSPKLHTSNDDSKNMDIDCEAGATSQQSPIEATSTEADLLSQPGTKEEAPPQSQSQEKKEQPVDSDLPEHPSTESDPSLAPTTIKAGPPPAANPAPRLHGTGALIVTKTTYVIPKKPTGSQSPSASASTSSQTPSSAQLNETRNLPVPPAPSAPSSRPSQPNTQVRQSIQRSLIGILFKRVCDCEDLEMSESEAAKLVASIESEMFDIFRNTDSKYMNKYRTIMFNLKDPRNKGLLYRVVRGEIGPFRLVRMSQKDMQATKAPEPSPKEPPEVATAKVLQKPEAVKVDLPVLNPPRLTRKPESVEQKKSLPLPILKTKTSQPSQAVALPNVFACMLKDTTSEHKTHLFDLKCKICTGQKEEEEPTKKKPKLSLSKDKHESSWRRSTGDDSPLRAPPDSPDMDSSTSLSFMLESPSRLVIDAPALTIVESPASPVMESPASPILESPASPVMDSPASPTPDPPKKKRAYTPVVIPAVSTVTITRRDPRTAANRFSASSSSTSTSSYSAPDQVAPYVENKVTPATQSANKVTPATQSAVANKVTPVSQPVPPTSQPPKKTLPKSILMKPSSSVDPRLYGMSSRPMVSGSPAEEESAQFLAKQEILWKGFLNMLTVAKFVTKAYLVSGSAENLKADLPDTIQIGGRILPQTVWDYVAKLKTSVTKELCVIRFLPATEEEEVAYVSLFSYFSSRGRFGVVSNNSRAIKDVYLVPLSAQASIPSILQPFEGPGLEKNRPNLLLGLAIIQKTKRPGMLPQETEEKRPKVHLSKDPLWIPKPPVLYGSDKLEIFQPYDPETPTSTTPPLGSPPCPGSPSDTSSSGSVTVPSLLTSIQAAPPVSTGTSVTVSQSKSSRTSDKNPISESNEKKALQSILKTLFTSNQSDSTVSSAASITKPTVSAKNITVPPQVSRSMVDPIVQQYGQKSKVKQMEEEKNDFDRPYDPEEEYDPAMGYETVAPQPTDKVKPHDTAPSALVEDDVAYDPEDETLFQDIQSDISVVKPPAQTPTLEPPSCPTPVSSSAPVQTSTPPAVTQTLPTGTVVVSAATLTEQQRMLEELNKQIEEQKRQLKEQEEALRQQREAVGMFMARFTVSDTLVSPPGTSLAPSQLPSVQSGKILSESKPSESIDADTSIPENLDNSNVDSKTSDLNDTQDNHDPISNTNTVDGETQENTEECNKYSSAGEIEDSDVAYDPEDESLFDEIQEDVFQGLSTKRSDSFMRAGHSGSYKSTSPNSYHSRKRRSSPSRRSRRERDHHRSPSKKSQQRSPSHSRRRRERDRHRRSERDRSRHRGRDPSERQGRHRKGRTTHKHSRGHRRSPSSPRTRDSESPSQIQYGQPFPQPLENLEHAGVQYSARDSFVDKSQTSSFPVTTKTDPDENQLKCRDVKMSDKVLPQWSLKHLHNIKVEISESQKFQSFPTTSIGDNDVTANDASTQLKKSAQPDHLLHDKLETTIPLREIDPPLRDSPESPDPDPQFVKPCCVEESDTATEEIWVRDEHANLPEQIVIPENSSQQIGGHTNSLTQLWSSVEDQQIETKSPLSKHLKTICPSTDPEKFALGVTNSQIMEQSSTKDEKEDPLLKDAPERNKPEGPVQAVCLIADTKVVNVRNQNVSFLQRDGEGRSPCSVGGNRSQEDRNENLDTESKELSSNKMGSQKIVRKKAEFHPHGKDADLTRVNVGSDRRFESNISSDCALEDKPFAKGTMNEKMKDVTGETQTRPGQNFCGLSHSKTRKTRWSADRDIGETAPSKMHGNTQGENTQNPWREKRNEQMDQGVGDMANMRSPNWRGPGCVGPNSRDNQTMKYGQSAPEMRGPSMLHLRHGIRGPEVPFFRAKPERIGGDGDLGVLDRGQAFAGLEERGISNNSRGPGIRVAEGADFVRTGLGVEGPRPDRRGPSDPSFRESWPERKGPVLESQGPAIRNVSGPWYERAGSHTVGSGPVRPRPGGPDTKGPFAENRGLTIEGLAPGPSLIGSVRPDMGLLRGPEFRTPGRESKGSPMEGQRPDLRESTSPNFSEPQSVHSCPNLEGPKSNVRIVGDTDFNHSGPERRDPTMEVPSNSRRAPGGPELRGPLPENRASFIEGPRLAQRGPQGPEFKGPGPQNHSSSMEGHGHSGGGPAGPEFREPGIMNRVLPMEGPGTGRRGPGGPEFRGPGPEHRGLSMESLGPNSRGLRGPDLSNSGFDGVAPTVCGPGPEHRFSRGPDFRRLGPELRGPNIDDPRPDRRRPVGQGFNRPEHERRGPSLESKGPDRGGPRGQDFREPGPERRCQPMSEVRGDQNSGGQVPDRRTTFMAGAGPWPERTGPSMEGRNPNMGVPGPERRCPVSDRRVPEGSNLAPGRKPPDMARPHFDGRGSQFRGPGPFMNGPRGQTFREPGCERRDPDSEGLHADKLEPGDLNLREPGFERRSLNMEGPGPDWRRPGGPNFRGQGVRLKGPHVEAFKHHTRDDWEVSEPIGESSETDVPGFEGSGPNFRGPRPMERNNRGPGPGFNTEDMETEGGYSEDNWESHGSGSSWPNQEGSEEHGHEHSWQGPCRQWRGRGGRRPWRGHERPNRQFSGPMIAAKEEENEQHCEEWKDQDGENSGPFFREESYSDNGGPGYARGRGRKPGSDIQEHPSFRTDRRRSMRRPYRGGPGAHGRGPYLNTFNRNETQMEELDRRGPRGPNFGPLGPGNRNSNIESPLTDEGCLHDVGDIEDPGPGGQTFEHDFPEERRGPKMRHLGPPPNSSDLRHGPGRWGTNTEFHESHNEYSDTVESGLDSRESEDRIQISDARGPGYDSRGPDMRNREPGPHQGGPMNRSLRPGPNNRGALFPRFANPQNQQTIRPQKHRSGLLPTPTGGLRFPNPMGKNPDVSST